MKDRIVIDKDEKAKIDGAANDIVTFINKEYAEATELIDKDWVELTLDKFYNPDKYKVPEENKNLEVIPMYEYYLEMHPLSEVRQRNNRVIIRALRRYEMYIRKTKRGKKKFVLMLNEVSPDTLHSIWYYFKQEHTLVATEEIRALFNDLESDRVERTISLCCYTNRKSSWIQKKSKDY